jgi:hypothetical protein
MGERYADVKRLDTVEIDRLVSEMDHFSRSDCTGSVDAPRDAQSGFHPRKSVSRRGGADANGISRLNIERRREDLIREFTHEDRAIRQVRQERLEPLHANGMSWMPSQRTTASTTSSNSSSLLSRL